MSQIYQPWQYFADPTIGKPVALGSVYFGLPDLDPEIRMALLLLCRSQCN
jgi:hypothetical protein